MKEREGYWWERDDNNSEVLLGAIIHRLDDAPQMIENENERERYRERDRE